MAAKMLIPNTRLSSPLGLGGFSTMNIRRWLPITSIIGDSLDQLDVYRTRVTSDELSSSAGVETNNLSRVMCSPGTVGIRIKTMIASDVRSHFLEASWHLHNAAEVHFALASGVH